MHAVEMSRQIAKNLLISNGLDPGLEETAFKHPYYELTIRRLLAGWTIEDALKGEKSYEVHDGVNRCECGSYKVLDRSMQTRSADEGMTHFFYCTICKKSWKT
jgi:DNA-directed RNA polymerase subunit M/transcription elongation factor TFIIS